MDKFYDALKQVKKMETFLLTLPEKEDKARFCSALQDLAPDYGSECTWLKRILEKDIHLEFIGKENINFVDKKQIVGKVKKRLEIEEGFGEKATERMISALIVIGDWKEVYRDNVLYEVPKQDNFYEIYKKSIPVQQLQQAAELGNPEAQYELGRLYYDGVLEKNMEVAFEWWRRAMEGDKEDILKDKVGLEYIRKSRELDSIKKKFEDPKESQKQGIIQYVKQYQNAKGKEIEKKKVRQIQIGDIIKFGKNDREWIVLDKLGNKVLIITKDIVEKRAYNETWKSVTWESCTLRKWLNREFLQQNFSLEERNRIQITLVKNWDNPQYGTDAGRDTQDKIFCLSIEEARKYFRDNKVKDEKSWWWLRSQGVYNSSVAVALGGCIFEGGFSVSSKESVRPALWLNLES